MLFRILTSIFKLKCSCSILCFKETVSCCLCFRHSALASLPEVSVSQKDEAKFASHLGTLQLKTKTKLKQRELGGKKPVKFRDFLKQQEALFRKTEKFTFKVIWSWLAPNFSLRKYLLKRVQKSNHLSYIAYLHPF